VECGGGKAPPEIRHRKDQPGASERKKGFLPGSVEPIRILHEEEGSSKLRARSRDEP